MINLTQVIITIVLSCISISNFAQVLVGKANSNYNTNLFLDTLAMYSGNYKAVDTLSSKNTLIPKSQVEFNAGKTVELQSPFEAPMGATLAIKIEDFDQVVGCCMENPLEEPFLQSYISGVVGYKIFQATDKNGNCLFKVDSDYSSSCDISLSDLPSYFYDCTGNLICFYGGFIFPPVNKCLVLFNTDFRDLDWVLIFSCDMP